MPTTEGYNGAFTGPQIDEAIGQVRNKNLPADGVKFTDGETFQQKYDSGELTGPQGDKGDTGETGAQGPKGDKGDTGAQGPAGTAATIAVGTVTTGEAGTSATVTNSGTSSAAVFNFTIPRGAKGDKGDTGDTGPAGAAGADGKSAYEYAQDAGYTGTEADLSAALASLGDLNSILDTINGEVI